MQRRLWPALVAAVAISGPPFAFAQQKGGETVGNQPQPSQSAPAESSHASGHDAQSGHPQSGEIEQTAPQAKRGKPETTGGPATQGMSAPAHESDTRR